MEIRFLNQSLPDNLKSADYNAKQTFIQKITKDLERQNKEKPFIKNYVEKYGYPDWQMVRWFKSNGETVAHIPLFFDNATETQAVMLAVEFDNKLKFRLFERDNFEKYAKNKKPVPNAEIIKDLFIIFDFQKFGESNLLPNGIIYAENKSSKLKSVSESILIEDCYYISTYTEKYGWTEERTNCITYYVWWNIEHSNPEDTGGGDGGDLPDQSGGSSPSPSPIVISSGLEKNAKAKCIYDKLLNGNILKDFISRYYPSASTTSPLGELNLTWTFGNTTAGSTAETFPIGVPLNGTYNSVEIRLNESIINSSSAILVAETMLHEALHAKLIAEVYDEMKTTNFLVLYAYYRNFPTANIDIEQEMQMLSLYSGHMAEALKAFDMTQGINNTLSFYSEALKYTFSDQLGLPLYVSGSDEYSSLINATKICN